MYGIKIKYLLFSLGVCFLAAAIGSFFTFESVRVWYPTLSKPFFNPPNWIFGPVWTILYVLMGVSCALVWSSKANKHKKKEALQFFFTQLIFNALWSIVFFGARLPAIAFGEIVALWLFIYFTIVRFRSIHTYASLMLVPYILWVSFASVLNFFIAIMN